jgi:hypothetical protein
LNYDATATVDDGSCIYDCEYPVISYTTYCEVGDLNNFYIEVVVTDLGNGAPYLVTNNVTGDELEITFVATIPFGPFANDEQVVITVNSQTLNGCIITSPILSDNCLDDSIDEENEITLSVIPNPNNGSFILNTDLVGNMQMRVYDLAGQLVWQDQRVAQPQNTIDLGDVATGTYILTVFSNDQIHQIKLVID